MKLLAGLALGLSCSAVSAQEILWQREGTLNALMIGGPSYFLGDVDGDGWSDVAHVARALVIPKTEDQILVLSGRDGQTLRVHRPPMPNYDIVWQFTGAGDMDGDGVRDYLVLKQANGDCGSGGERGG